MSFTTEIEQPLAIPTSIQVLKLDSLWRKALSEEDTSAIKDFNALYVRCNDDAKSCINGFRERDIIEKAKKRWKKISTGIDAISAFKAGVGVLIHKHCN